MKERKIQKKKLDKLVLDVNNPRFAELYSGSTNEEDIIEYLLFNESADKVAEGISKVDEFYPDRPLWVYKDGTKFIVKDGNRRCAAVKALQTPTKFSLSIPRKEFTDLPVIVYDSLSELNKRILEEHTSSLFKEWDRIAKALEAFKLFTSGNSIDSIKDLDSQPSQLVKLASFYYNAVTIEGEELKKLLRRGRGKTGGKTIIFERLFKYSKKCGYYFKNKPSYQVKITDQHKFDDYVKALVSFLKANPKTKTQDIDNQGEDFLKKLKSFGFDAFKTTVTTSSNATTGSTAGTTGGTETSNSTSSNTSTGTGTGSGTSSGTGTNSGSNSGQNNSSNSQGNTSTGQGNSRRGSVKTKPTIKRRSIPATLNKLIKECYNLDKDNFYNAKTAITRVTLECTLKYVVENTKYNSTKAFNESNYFRPVFFLGNGNKRAFTDFKKLKQLFSELITMTSIRKAFENFNIETTHQIIHNYLVGAVPSDAESLCFNLIPIIDFLLQEEQDLLNGLDLTKL